MLTSWKNEHRRTVWIAALGLIIWGLLIYWQGEISWLGLGQALATLLAFNFAEIPAPYGSLFLDVFLFTASGFLWALLFAHFVLPVDHPHELGTVLKAMMFSLLGRPPVAIIFKNGSPNNSGKENRKSKAASVFLLDVASAAVLRTTNAFTRVIGPGLSFAKESEYLAGSLDLHIQRRTLGPLANEDPFGPKEQGEEIVSFRKRQERRQETSALTQDGVEIVPRIEVDFRVEGGAPKEGKPFPFQAEFVWRALAYEGNSPLGSNNEKTRSVSWDWLPVHLATDLWREYLGKFSVHDLFETEPAIDNSSSGLERLEEFINTRLTSAIVPESFNPNEINSRNTSSTEYQLLRSRGCRVLKVRLRELHLDPLRDETRLVNEWSEAWEMRAIQASIKDGSRHEEKERSGQYAAAAEFLRLVSSPLFTRLKVTDGKDVTPPSYAESLELLLKGSLEGASQIPALPHEVSDRLQRMVSLLGGLKDE